MEVNCQFHNPAASPFADEPPVIIDQEGEWAPRRGLGDVKSRKLYFPCQGSISDSSVIQATA